MIKVEKNALEFEVEWRKRKRGWMEIIDILSEGMDKKPTEIMEELGIETDEDCNIICPKK